MRLIIRPTFASNSFSIWLIREENGRKYRVAKPIQIEFGDVVDDGFILPPPTMEIPSFEIQSLIESVDKTLIENGLKKQSSNIEGVLEAQSKHLEDMRTICFAKVKMNWEIEK